MSRLRSLIGSHCYTYITLILCYTCISCGPDYMAKVPEYCHVVLICQTQEDASLFTTIELKIISEHHKPKEEFAEYCQHVRQIDEEEAKEFAVCVRYRRSELTFDCWKDYDRISKPAGETCRLPITDNHDNR